MKKILLSQLVEFVNSQPLNYWGKDQESNVCNKTQTDLSNNGNLSKEAIHTVDIDTEVEKKKLHRLIKNNFYKSDLCDSIRLLFDESVMINVTAMKDDKTNCVT